MADIKIDGTDSTKINLEVADSNDLNLKLTGGDKGLRLHVLETIYPVGSIYTNAGVATNPGTLLGFGTWSAFGTGRVIVGVDSSDTDFDAVRETGGSKTHTLTIAELPSHTHQTTLRGNGEDENLDLPSASDNSDPSRTMTSGATGGGAAHTIVQPYITAYMWRRTA
jgi:hypothetical protein